MIFTALKQKQLLRKKLFSSFFLDLLFLEYFIFLQKTAKCYLLHSPNNDNRERIERVN